MKLQRLKIENFRGIRKMQIDFDQQLNVFAGKNGTGKTSIINALGRGIDVAHMNHIAGNDRKNLESNVMIHLNDINTKEKHAHINLEFLFKGKKVSTSVSSDPAKMSSNLFSCFPEPNTFIPHRTFSEDRSTMANTYTLTAKSQEMITGIDPVLGSIVQNTTRYGAYFNWLADREDLENSRLRKFIDSGKDFHKDTFEKDKRLQAVKKAIKDVTGFSGLFNDREKNGFVIEKSIGSKKESFVFSQLSTGEKQFISLIAALAITLSIEFPESDNFLNEEALFMIDSIELNLHPSWQQKAISNLLSVFPNCQFIVTTHSPHVITHVKPEQLFLLKMTDKGVVVEQPNESYGKNADRILEDLMGLETTRPDEVDNLLKELYETINAGEIDRAKEQVANLRGLIGEDPEIVKAAVLIKRKEVLGK